MAYRSRRSKNYARPASVAETKKNVDSRVFYSLDEFLAFLADCKAKPPKNWIKEWLGDNYGNGASDWNGWTDNTQHMLNILREGWKAGADRVAQLRAMADPIVSEMKAKIDSVTYDVTGQWLDIGKFVTGDPECFGSILSVDTSVNSNVVRIDCGLAVSCGVSADRMFSRGAAACAFADIVESAGKRCEIWAVDSCQAGNTNGDAKEWFQTRILVKAAHEPLDMARIAAVLAHPGFQRRVVFDYHSAMGYHDGWTYPKPYNYDSLPADQQEFQKEPGVVVFPELHLDMAGSPEGFKKLMGDCLAAAGMSIEGFDEISLDF